MNRSFPHRAIACPFLPATRAKHADIKTVEGGGPRSAPCRPDHATPVVRTGSDTILARRICVLLQTEPPPLPKGSVPLAQAGLRT